MRTEIPIHYDTYSTDAIKLLLHSLNIKVDPSLLSIVQEMLSTPYVHHFLRNLGHTVAYEHVQFKLEKPLSFERFVASDYFQQLDCATLQLSPLEKDQCLVSYLCSSSHHDLLACSLLPRPNHGLAHTVRQVLMTSMVMQHFEQYGTEQIRCFTGQLLKNKKGLKKIQSAILFCSIGRLGEHAFNEAPLAYSYFRWRSAEFFLQIMRQSHKDKPWFEHIGFDSAQELLLFNNAILHMGKPNTPLAILLSAIHKTDLIRCYNSEDFQQVFNGFMSEHCLTSEDNSQSLLRITRRAYDLLAATGDTRLATIDETRPSVEFYQHNLFDAVGSSLGVLLHALAKCPANLANALRPALTSTSGYACKSHVRHYTEANWCADRSHGNLAMVLIPGVQQSLVPRANRPKGNYTIRAWEDGTPKVSGRAFKQTLHSKNGFAAYSSFGLYIEGGQHGNITDYYSARGAANVTGICIDLDFLTFDSNPNLHINQFTVTDGFSGDRQFQSARKTTALDYVTRISRQPITESSISFPIPANKILTALQNPSLQFYMNELLVAVRFHHQGLVPYVAILSPTAESRWRAQIEAMFLLQRFKQQAIKEGVSLASDFNIAIKYKMPWSPLHNTDYTAEQRRADQQLAESIAADPLERQRHTEWHCFDYLIGISNRTLLMSAFKELLIAMLNTGHFIIIEFLLSRLNQKEKEIIASVIKSRRHEINHSVLNSSPAEHQFSLLMQGLPILCQLMITALKDNPQYNPLRWLTEIAHGGHEALIQWMFHHHIQPDTQAYALETVLQIAATNGYSKMIANLLSYHLSNSCNNNYQQAIDKAALLAMRGWHYRAFRTLAAAISEQGLRSCLEQAVACDQHQFAVWLCSQHRELKISPYTENNPLLRNVIEDQNVELFTFLLNHGAKAVRGKEAALQLKYVNSNRMTILIYKVYATVFANVSFEELMSLSQLLEESDFSLLRECVPLSIYQRTLTILAVDPLKQTFAKSLEELQQFNPSNENPLFAILVNLPHKRAHQLMSHYRDLLVTHAHSVDKNHNSVGHLYCLHVMRRSNTNSSFFPLFRTLLSMLSNGLLSMEKNKQGKTALELLIPSHRENIVEFLAMECDHYFDTASLTRLAASKAVGVLSILRLSLLILQELPNSRLLIRFYSLMSQWLKMLLAKPIQSHSVNEACEALLECCRQRWEESSESSLPEETARDSASNYYTGLFTKTQLTIKQLTVTAPAVDDTRQCDDTISQLPAAQMH